MKLEQKDVARMLDADKSTICNWENNKTQPMIRHYPKIMAFLGYCPLEFPKTYGDRLRLHRTHKGLSCRRLAEVLKVDPASVRRWEERETPPYKYLQAKIEHFLNDLYV